MMAHLARAPRARRRPTGRRGACSSRARRSSARDRWSGPHRAPRDARRRRDRDRRLRQLGRRRPGADHQPARHRRPVRRGPHPRPGGPLRACSAARPGRADRPVPVARDLARRRGRCRRAGPGAPGRRPPLDYPRDALRAEAGMVDGVDSSAPAGWWNGCGPSRRCRCSASTLPRPVRPPTPWSPAAKAKLSLRIAPGDRPEGGLRRDRRHLDAHAPWGAQVR